MNKHYHDAAYYGRRTGEHAKLGLLETVQPVRSRVDELRGVEPEPEGRVEELLGEVRELETRAKGEARDRFAAARQHLESDRATA